MRFKKIKYDTKEVTLLWTTEKSGETHEHTLTSDQAPHPDFIEAMQALVEDVRRICELPMSFEDGMRVQSVSLSYSEKTGAGGAVITALKTLSAANAPLVLSTPHLVDEGETGVMPFGMQERLEVLIEAYPDAVSRDEISDRTEYKRSSRDTYLQRLGARKLVTTAGRAAVRASDTLFDRARR